MRSWRRAGLLAVCIAALLAAVGPAQASDARSSDWTIRDGRLHVDGRWVFLKIGKPLRKFSDPAACEKLIADLDTLQAKGFNTLELNCYWHHFDTDADGTIDVSLEPLARLIDAINAKGMFPCLSVETYGVGGGKIPDPFWKRHPDAIAINADGQEARDLEYGFKTAVPSLFSAAYLQASRAFIRALVAYSKTFYFLDGGHQDIDYSPHAKQAYAAWMEKQGLDGPAWPEAFPVPGEFRSDPIWLRFRAESLADWVNGDAAAFRDVAGKDAYVAVDYLETGNATMPRRNGDSVRFLEALTCADIIQVNWHWRTDLKGPNECAYRTDRVGCEGAARAAVGDQRAHDAQRVGLRSGRCAGHAAQRLGPGHRLWLGVRQHHCVESRSILALQRRLVAQATDGRGR